jgi:O-antigen ligase
MKYVNYKNICLLTIASFPVFALIIRGWTSAVLFASLLLSIIYFAKQPAFTYTAFHNELYQKNKNLRYLAASFLLPTVCILLTSLFKLEFNWRNLDGPSRYIFAILILTFLLRVDLAIEKILIFSISLMPIMTALLIGTLEKKAWSALPRTTSYFIDPITFGSLCLAFGLLSLVLLLHKPRTIPKFIWFTISAFCGFYLSIRSESRTGWIALPFVILLLVKTQLKLNYKKTILVGSILIALSSFTLYHSSEVVKNRFDQVAQEVHSYQWQQGSNSTSIGERITYIRMGLHLIALRPLSGWANLDMSSELSNPQFSRYATPETRLGVKGGGFHNEYINNGVKYGIPGIVFTLFLFLGPALFFIRILKEGADNLYALLGLTYIITQAVSALSYQVLDFKFTASLYALMMITLAHSALQQKFYK